MTLQLKPIKPKKISDQVFEQIRELIFRGQLKAGQQLLPERDLAEALQVSRTTVRNAINKMVVMGLLDHRQGQGTFVRSPDTWRQGNPLAAGIDSNETTVQDLLEVRLGLECNAAALAAQRAEPKDLEFMERHVKELEANIMTGKFAVEPDTSFHMAIAFATKNSFHVYIMKNFYDLLFVGIKKNLIHLYEEPENLGPILNQHLEIYRTIKEHNPEGAYKAMQTHIQFVIDFFKNRGSG